MADFDQRASKKPEFGLCFKNKNVCAILDSKIVLFQLLTWLLTGLSKARNA